MLGTHSYMHGHYSSTHTSEKDESTQVQNVIVVIKITHAVTVTNRRRTMSLIAFMDLVSACSAELFFSMKSFKIISPSNGCQTKLATTVAGETIKLLAAAR